MERRRISNRKGKVFFGLCDMRIATVLLNTVHIVIALILVIVALFNDGAIVVPVTAIVLSSLSICAAMNFLFVVSCFCTFGMLVMLICYAFTLHLVSFALTGVILFAQSFFLHEMLTGVMSRANYANEEFITDEGRQTLEAAHVVGSDLAASTRCLGRELADETQQVADKVVQETKGTVDSVVKSGSAYLAPALLGITMTNSNDDLYRQPVAEC
jgi:hypothetical protein